MDTHNPSLSIKGISYSYNENKNKRMYTKKNPPTVEKISRRLRGQEIREDNLKGTKDIK